MNNKYKLLILQGGGYYGLIDITFLTYLGNEYNVAAKINSMSGTSIGGILTCGLMGGATPQKIQKMFLEKGGQIFKRRNKNILDIPWYSDEGLSKAMTELIGDQTIGDTRKLFPNTSMYVPVMNLTKSKLKVYNNINECDKEVKLLDVALQTSAAMFYFPLRNVNGDAITDGGIREVCPVISHATQMKQNEAIHFEDMDVFVIGAGQDLNKKYGNYSKVNEWGVIDWIKFIINDITASNENTSKQWGQNIGFNSFTWFNPVQIYGSMDDVSEANYMLDECLMYKEQFLQKWNKFIN